MKPALRRVGTGVALAAAGAVTGGLATFAAMPYIRQADPLWLSSVVLISGLGITAFVWYFHGRAEPGAEPDRRV